MQNDSGHFWGDQKWTCWRFGFTNRNIVLLAVMSKGKQKSQSLIHHIVFLHRNMLWQCGLCIWSVSSAWSNVCRLPFSCFWTLLFSDCFGHLYFRKFYALMFCFCGGRWHSQQKMLVKLTFSKRVGQCLFCFFTSALPDCFGLWRSLYFCIRTFSKLFDRCIFLYSESVINSITHQDRKSVV